MVRDDTVTCGDRKPLELTLNSRCSDAFAWVCKTVPRLQHHRIALRVC